MLYVRGWKHAGPTCLLSDSLEEAGIQSVFFVCFVFFSAGPEEKVQPWIKRGSIPRPPFVRKTMQSMNAIEQSGFVRPLILISGG